MNIYVETFNPSPLPLHKGRALKPPPYVRGIEGVKGYCFESDKVEPWLVLLRHFDNQEEHQTHASYYHLSL